MARKSLPVACAINGDYALPLIVTLTSAVEHLDPSYQIQLFLLHDGLGQDVINKIASLVDLHLVELSADTFDRLPDHDRYPAVAAYPLLLPDVLPETLRRVLFLDADLLVLDDLAQLWETPTAGRAVAGAPDGAIHFCSSPRGVRQWREWGIPEVSTYFNCGVLLIDLEAWRNREVARRAFNYLRHSRRQVDFLHQEALNAVLWSDWQPLDRRWNMLGSVAGRPHEHPPSASVTPGIVHFAGRFKPWRAPVAGPYYARYSAFLLKALQWTAPIRPTVRDRMLSLYDRRLRNSLYRCERVLWNYGLF